MSVESQIKKYEQEIKAIKASFEQSAAEMPISSTDITFNTSINRVTYTYPSTVNPLEWQEIISMPRLSQNTACGDEPIIVTFDCADGINTFANLEIEKLSGADSLFGISVRRLIYSGGARWLVIVQPNVTQGGDGWYTWATTRLRFVIKSAAQGTLGAKMIWQ